MRLQHEALAICLLGITLYGCMTECTLQPCFFMVELEVTDSQGQPVESMYGQIVADGQLYLVECDGPTAALRPVVEPGASGLDVDIPPRVSSCANGMIWLGVYSVDPNHPGDFQIEINLSTATGERFEGTIVPSVYLIEDFGGEGCGSCPRGEASIVLE